MKFDSKGIYKNRCLHSTLLTVTWSCLLYSQVRAVMKRWNGLCPRCSKLPDTWKAGSKAS